MRLRIIPDIISDRQFTQINFKATVREAAQFMQEMNAGAVMITRGDGSLKGILTERDVAFRVVAPGRDPDWTHLINVITEAPETIAGDSFIQEALTKMYAGGYRHLPVLDGNILFGLISIADIYYCAYGRLKDKLKSGRSNEALKKTIVPNVLSDQDIIQLAPSATVREAARVMAENRIGAILVASNGKLEGIFTEHDVTRRVVAAALDPDKTPLGEVMTANPTTVTPNDTCGDVLESMSTGGFQHLPVHDGSRLYGMASLRDVYGVMKTEIEEEFGHVAAWAQRMWKAWKAA